MSDQHNSKSSAGRVKSNTKTLSETKSKRGLTSKSGSTTSLNGAKVTCARPSVTSDVVRTPSNQSRRKSKSKSASPDRKKALQIEVDIKKRGSTVSKNIELDVVVNVDTTQLKIKHRIGFVGAGKMAYSIVKGLIRYSGVSHKQIFVAAKTERNLVRFYRNEGILTSTRIYDIFGKFNCDVVFLCLPGYVIKACYRHSGLRPMALATNYLPDFKHPYYFISLIGGVTLDEIRKTLLDPDNPDKYYFYINRVVLNQGVVKGRGLCITDHNIEGGLTFAAIIKLFLMPMCMYTKCQPIEMMDALCTLCGSGLAFIYFFIEAMSEGGLKVGLNKTMGVKLAAKALMSAAESMKRSKKDPSELKDSVLSIGGPAIYGIDHMNQKNCESGIISAVEAAYRRLKEVANTEPDDLNLRPFNC